MLNWWKGYQREKRREQLVIQLLAAAHEAGLLPRDYSNAQDMLAVGEWECAFDIIVHQLYEYEIEVPASLFALVQQAADSMLLTPGSYFFLGELVRSANHIPVPVRRKVATLISSLQSQR